MLYKCRHLQKRIQKQCLRHRGLHEPWRIQVAFLHPFTDMSYEIRPHCRIGRGLWELARTEITQIIAAFRALNSDTLDGLTHEIRQRLKRLRAVIRLLREPLGRRRYRAEDSIIRAAGRALGPLREGQAALTTLDGLQRRFFPGKPPATLLAAREKLATQAQQCASVLVGSAVLTTQISALEGVIERLTERPVEGFGWKEMRRAIECSYRCSKEHWEQAHDASDADRLHCWRKRANDLWQYLRMLRRVCPTFAAEMAREYEVLGAFLGDYHDLVVLRATLEKQGDVLLDLQARETFIKLLELRMGELFDAASTLGERLHVHSPTAFAHALGEHRAAFREGARKARKLSRRFIADEGLPHQRGGQTLLLSHRTSIS